MALSRPTGRRRICRRCLVRTLAGVAWPMWGGRDGWPRLTRCVDHLPASLD